MVEFYSGVDRRADFFFFGENSGLIPFLDEIGDRLVIAPMRFYDDKMEPIVGAICYSHQNFAEGEAIAISPEVVLYGSQYDPIRCLPVFVDENDEWKIDPYIVTSYAGEYDDALNDSGIQQQLPDPEDGTGRTVASVYHTHRNVPMFPFLHRMRERPRPRSVAAIRDGRFGFSIMYVTPSGQSWKLERVDGEAILTSLE